MTQHAEFSPSQLARIIACPGSVRLYREIQPEDSQSEYAAEGELMHKYMEQVVWSEFTKLQKFNWYDIENPEHRAACKSAYEYVCRHISNKGRYDIFTERKYDILEPHVFGTCDLVAVDTEWPMLHIFDYKFGANIKVDAAENPQLIAYAVGAVKALAPRMSTQGLTIRMHIVQPRMDNYQVEDMSMYELSNWFKRVLVPTVTEANSDYAPLNPSPKACRWCKVKARCPEAYKEAQKAAKQVFKMYASVERAEAITTAELAKFYHETAILEKHIKAVKDYVLAELLRGHKIPGYKVVYGRSNRKWKDEEGAVKYLAEWYEADYEDLYETKIKSPAQVEKMYPGCKKDNNFRKFLEVPQGAPRVVNADEEDTGVNPFSSVMEEKN